MVDNIHLDKDKKLFRRSINLETANGRTFLIVMAVSSSIESNSLHRMPTNQGVPLGGYVHDVINDCYYVRCVDFLSLGVVPVSYQMTIDNWRTRLPLPENVLRRHLNSSQTSDLDRFKRLYKDHSISFLQLISE